MNFLAQTYERLLDTTTLSFKRYLHDIFQLSRMICLVGPRGVGKTTFMLQYIKENLIDEPVFYFSADSVFFKQTTLLEYINDLYNLEGYRYFFIDEIHKYDNWNQELKNLYDAFPDIYIVYTGSSMLEITQGSHDLSRRVNTYHLPGMSFREYLSFQHQIHIDAHTPSALTQNPKQFNAIGLKPQILKFFKAYLEGGYYPFYFEEPISYYERVMRILDKIIFEDIPSYFDLKTQNLPIFKKILSFLASIPPGEVNTNNIAQNIGISHQTISHYLSILEQVGLIQLIYPFEGGNQLLRKPQKIFLHNTTLLYTLQEVVGEALHQGTLRELFFIQALRDANTNIYYSKQGDFRTKDTLFEIGGKNKTTKQIVNADLPTMLVKDDILTATSKVIPLLFFGFTY